MKEHIMYYYNLLDIDILEKSGCYYYFKCHGRLFSLEYVSNIDKTKKVFEVLQKVNFNRGYQVIYNIYDEIFTNISNNWYVLFLCNNEKYNILQDLLHPINVTGLFSFNYKFSWNYLWSKKVDYYEYQFNHIYEMYPLIFESFNYYIGLAENAISYFSYNLHSLESFDVFLCHERISYSNYFDPLNVTVDYYARDIAEYIKFLFFSKKYDAFSFSLFFQKLELSYNDYILLFSRLLFPSYYFDIYDRIINHECNEDALAEVILLVNDYYLLLQKTFENISYFANIPAIDWIKK